MPAVGETVAVRVDGGHRVWMAEVRMVSTDLLVVQLDFDSYRNGHESISIGQFAHVTGLRHPAVRVRAESRGQNGSLLLLRDPTVELDRLKRGLVRVEKRSSLWCALDSNPTHQQIEVFDVSVGGICTTALDGMQVGQHVCLSDSPAPETADARGVIVGLTTTAERGDHAHIAFLAGTDPEVLECLAAAERSNDLSRSSEKGLDLEPGCIP